MLHYVAAYMADSWQQDRASGSARTIRAFRQHGISVPSLSHSAADLRAADASDRAGDGRPGCRTPDDLGGEVTTREVAEAVVEDNA